MLIIISNIESTLVDFTDGVSRKEAAVIQAYLKQAFSKYAAFDSTPSPPPIPPHSLPGKAGGKIAHRLSKKPVVAAAPVRIPSSIPALVRKDKNQPKENNQTQLVSWGTAARNGTKNSVFPNYQFTNTLRLKHKRTISREGNSKS